MALTQVDQGLLGQYAQYTGFKNRIINGAMMIDQRNAGASVTGNNGVYLTDRWRAGASLNSKFTGQQSTTAPTGFANSLLITSSSSYSVPAGETYTLAQFIEGFNTADLGWGTASAATVTLSFWVRSSLTGTFGGAIQNGAANRSYPFTYTISSANTWEYKTVTITGDTSGTWIGATNGIGIRIWFGLGAGSTYSGTAGSWASADYRSATGATSVVGTNGATWQVTGVQLEKGSTATSFDYRPYGTELSLCQRYLPAFSNSGAGIYGVGMAGSASTAYITIPFAVNTRVPPTGITVATAASTFSTWNNAASQLTVTSISFNQATSASGTISASVASGMVAGNATVLASNSTTLFYFTGCEL